VLDLFWKFWIFRVQHLDYCSYCLFVTGPKCWYCSGSHILHIKSSKSIQNQIPWKSARWTQGEWNLRGFSGKSGFPGYSGPGPETPSCKGINTFDRGEKVPFILLQFNRTPSLPVASLPPHPSPWAISTFHRPNLVKVRVWRLQGVEIKDLLKIQRIQVFSPHFPRYIQRSFSWSTSLE
jgi:hypothetical protein